MVPAYQSITLTDFKDAVSNSDKRHPLTPPGYARRRLMSSVGDTCPLCRQPYDRSRLHGYSHPVLGAFIHPYLGGPLNADNFFVCCRRCQNARQASDLLAVDALPVHLAAQRLTVLQLSSNHLVPLPKSAGLPRVRAALEARHALPRSRVYAAQTDDGTCFIALTTRYGDGQSKGLTRLLSKLGGRTVWQDKRLTVFQLPDDAFRDTVWKLIEANALVVGLARRRECRDAQDWWWLTSASVGELKKRQVGKLSAPFPVIVREVGESAIRQRRMVARRRLEAELVRAQQGWEEAEWLADRYMESRSNPQAFPTDPEEALQILAQPGLAYDYLQQVKGDYELVRKRID